MARLAREGRNRPEQDGEFLEEPEPLPLDRLPPISGGFSSGDSLSFALEPGERKYLREKLVDLPPKAGSGLSLLAKLVREMDPSGRTALGFLRERNCWGAKLLSLAGDERENLVRAGRAAAMAAIGRGVYAALVEGMRESDGLPATRLHRDGLRQAVVEHRLQALRLDVDLLESEIPGMPVDTVAVLRRTQTWLNAGSQNVAELQDAYRRTRRAIVRSSAQLYAGTTKEPQS